MDEPEVGCFVDFSKFPFSHTGVFSRIVESLDSSSLLTCRAVCFTWLRWVKKTKIWTQLMPIRLALARKKAEDNKILVYRLDRIQLMPRDSEADCRALAIKVDRVIGESVPSVSNETMMIVSRLLKYGDEGAMDFPVIGPMAAFVRIKVDHKVIQKIVKETLSRYLNGILVDKKDMEKEVVRRCVLRAMHLGQNWIHVDFQGRKGEGDQDNQLERGLRGEMSLEDALKESLKSEDEAKKRDREDEANEEELNQPKSKRSKVDFEDDLNEGEEDPNEHIEPCVKSHPRFPTLLELLDFDDPLIREVLIQRLQIDKMLIVPQFEQFLLQQDLFQTSFAIHGVDPDGKVSHVEPGKFNDKDDAIMGYVEHPTYMQRFTTEQIMFWGQKDVRHHWPEFSRQLETLDQNEKEGIVKKEKKTEGSELVKTVKVVSRKTGGTGWAQQSQRTQSIEVELPPGDSEPSRRNQSVDIKLASASDEKEPVAGCSGSHNKSGESESQPSSGEEGTSSGKNEKQPCSSMDIAALLLSRGVNISVASKK